MESNTSSNTEDGPRVSILIPNFNNGREASRSGKRDFITDLLKSLERTLGGESTPFEIIAFDDGSNDDSIDTLRHWAAEKTWSDGRPFLCLMEAPHCGVLSVTANKLYRAAAGDILVRLDGDIICLTPNWVTKICEVFDQGPPKLGVIGPKQLSVRFLIHSMGDWILHPKGYHHIGFSLPRYQIRRTMEVDHVMGCFYCCKREVYVDVGGFDERMMRGQTIDFGLRARLKGWSCWAIPDVEFIHAHSERDDRATTADSAGGVNESIDYFEEKWGFSRIAPDLDFVRERYKGTPLLWNARWFDGSNRNDPKAVWSRAWPAPACNLSAETSEWALFASDESYRKKMLMYGRNVFDVIRQSGPVERIAHLCCGCGLFAHLLAQNGLSSIGLDIHEEHVRLARDLCGRQKYAEGINPQFETINDARKLPLDDDSVDLVAVTDQMERHPNPVGLLKEIRRILKPNGHLVITAEKRIPCASNEMQEEHIYVITELVNQIKSISGVYVIGQTGTQSNENLIGVAAQFLPNGIADRINSQSMQAQSEIRSLQSMFNSTSVEGETVFDRV